MLSGIVKFFLLSQPSACPPFPVFFLFCNTSAKKFWVDALCCYCFAFSLPALPFPPLLSFWSFFFFLFLFHKLLLDHISLLCHFFKSFLTITLCRIWWGLFLQGSLCQNVTWYPLLLHHCLWAPVLSLPLFPGLICLPQNSGLAHSPESLRQGQPGRAELELLLPQVWPQESTGPPGRELAPAAPSGWHNYTWEGQFCLRNFLQGIWGDYWR